MRAFLSRSHGSVPGVRSLRPELYAADRAWLAATAADEARAILAETEPESRCPEAVTTRIGLNTLARSVRHPGIAFTLTHDIQASLAEALAAFVGEGN